MSNTYKHFSSIAFRPMTEFKLERDSIYKCTIGETHVIIIIDSQMSQSLWCPSLLFACLTFSIFTSLARQHPITDYHESAFSLHTAMDLLLDIGGFIMSAQKAFLYLSRVCLSGNKRPFHSAQFFYDYRALNVEIEMEIQHEPLMAAITLNKIPYVCVFPGQPGALLSFGLLL